MQTPTSIPMADDSFDEALRPTVAGAGGRAVTRLSNAFKVMLDATHKRGDTLGHLLLDGPPGIGKTTLATVIPRELGVDIQICLRPRDAGPQRPASLSDECRHERSVLFIDEVHRLPAAVEEFLYPAMEDFRVDIALGEGLNARTINMQLKPFTVIGATTRSGMLTAPMRDRFVYREHLDFL